MGNNLKIDEVIIGSKFTIDSIKTVCDVTNKTTNSVEMFVRTDRNNRYSSGERDADGELMHGGKLKGIDGKQYYTISDFNKRFTEIK